MGRIEVIVVFDKGERVCVRMWSNKLHDKKMRVKGGGALSTDKIPLSIFFAFGEKNN